MAFFGIVDERGAWCLAEVRLDVAALDKIQDRTPCGRSDVVA